LWENVCDTCATNTLQICHARLCLAVAKDPFTRYNLLSNRLWNRFNNRLTVCIHDTTSCQNGLTTGCIVYTNIQPVWQLVWLPAVLCIQPVVKPVVQRGLITGWTNSCSFNTVVKPVWQPVWQPVGCLFTRYSQLSNRLYNRFDNRLYRVNGVWQNKKTGTLRDVVNNLTWLEWHGRVQYYCAWWEKCFAVRTLQTCL